MAPGGRVPWSKVDPGRRTKGGNRAVPPNLQHAGRGLGGRCGPRRRPVALPARPGHRWMNPRTNDSGEEGVARLPPRLRPPPPARDGGGEMRGKKNAWTAGDTPRLAPSPDGSLRLFAAPFRRRPTADPVALRSAVLCAVCPPSSHGCGGCRRDGTSHAPAAANSVGSPAPPPPHLALGSSPRTQPTQPHSHKQSRPTSSPRRTSCPWSAAASAAPCGPTLSKP